jgi:photosystem II stability/assembly factor-like uncharacterized protein
MQEPPDTRYITGIALYAPGRGYMMNSSGGFFHTIDNGAHWAVVPSPKPAGWEFARSVYAVLSMRFVDAAHGTLVMHLKRGDVERVMAYHTDDAGQSWSSEPVPVEPGPLYLAQDGRLLTVITGPNIMTVLRYRE